MTAIIITATAEHDCNFKHCPKANKIIVGEKAVKTTGRRSTCGETYTTTVYYHEECYNAKGGERGRR